ncbi:hypothetical protein M885DRAFT_578586 [Pelagophyceae sp. CCMP2097]|nr:hypothetical protein M885DRAFT_578586 [Pelagophyceae sp. CCMP2097]
MFASGQLIGSAPGGRWGALVATAASFQSCLVADRDAKSAPGARRRPAGAAARPAKERGASEADKERGSSEADEKRGASEADEERGSSEADEKRGSSEADEKRAADATHAVDAGATSAPSPWPTVTSCIGAVLALALAVALVMEIFLVLREFTRQERHYEEKVCDDAADAATRWGKWLAAEAYALGAAMTLERRLGLAPMTPFLLPGLASTRFQLEKMVHVPALYGGANSHMTPSIVWNPTVLDADREAYEAFMSRKNGFPVNISNVDYVVSQGREIATKTPAPHAESYHPASAMWSVLGDATADAEVRAQHVGTDLPLVRPGRETTELLVHRRLVAHAPFTTSDAVADALLMVEVPFCGLGGCEDNALVGVFTFMLSADNWSALFPDNFLVRVGSPSVLIKTPDKNRGGGYADKVKASEPFLDLDIHCYYTSRSQVHYCRRPMFALTVCAAAAVAFVVALLAKDHRLRRRAAEARWLDQLEKVAAERRELQKIHAAKLVERSEANERMERYVSHEIKNRLVVLGQLCSEEAQLELVDEMAEMLNEKLVLVRLSSFCYEARLDETVDLDSLVDKRLRRHRDANCPFVRVPTAGAAAAAASALRLDALLVKIVFDNILSNAFKYGCTTRAPTLTMRVEPDGSERFGLFIELTNWAGPEHAALLEMGEAELNRIAGAEGERAHTSTANTMSSGDGFPMAVVAAHALGGTLRLRLSEAGVVAHLALSGVALDPGAQRSSSLSSASPSTDEHIVGEARPVDPSQLTMALVDDSALQRKVFTKHIGKIALHGPPVIVAGDTRQSIDDFAKTVCDVDVDIVFTDQHFAPVHHTKAGTDIVSEIRALDAAAGRPPRLIFVASGNDSPEDAAAYSAAGADGSLSKVSLPQLKALLDRHATMDHPRFKARATALV